MTQSQWNAIEQLIPQMTSAEKRELIARVANSLVPQVTEEELDAQQRALEKLHDIMAKLPVMNPDDGFTSADHDRILYGRPV